MYFIIHYKSGVKRVATNSKETLTRIAVEFDCISDLEAVKEPAALEDLVQFAATLEGICFNCLKMIDNVYEPCPHCDSEERERGRANPVSP